MKNLEKEHDNKSEKIVVVENEPQNKDPHRFTWQKMWLFIGKYKYWVLSATLIGLLGGFLGANYVLNPKKQNFTTTFTLKLPENNTFDYSTMISAENIKNMALTKADQNYNTDEIISSNSLNISKVVETVYVDGTQQSAYKPMTFKITGNVKPFDNVQQIVNFINDLTNYTVVNYYTGYISTLNSSVLHGDNEIEDYATKLSAYELNFTNLNNIINTLSKTFGPSTYINDSNDTIGALYNTFTYDFVAKNQYYLDWVTFNIKNGFISNKLTQISSIYVGSSTSKPEDFAFVNFSDETKEQNKVSITNNLNQTNNQITRVTDEISSLNTQIKDILDSINTSSTDPSIYPAILDTLFSQLATYKEQLSSFNKRKMFLEAQLTNISRAPLSDSSSEEDKTYYANKQVFDDSLASFDNLLTSYKTQTEEATNYILANSSIVSFEYTDIIDVSGGYNAYLVMVAGAVALLVLSSIVVCIVGQYKERKRTLPKEVHEKIEDKKPEPLKPVEIENKPVEEKEENEPFDPSQPLFK